ncbi:hypothetical protein [Micromonospora sp. NPDC005197]|uniref:hypothetical protein n=1 Tax=Micromonospora sp. NPDC005197 TaxID=3157020 RepID=UPI0033A19C80
MSRPTGAHRIVVGVDRSFAGMQALRRATQLAAATARSWTPSARGSSRRRGGPAP